MWKISRLSGWPYFACKVEESSCANAGKEQKANRTKFNLDCMGLEYSCGRFAAVLAPAQIALAAAHLRTAKGPRGRTPQEHENLDSVLQYSPGRGGGKRIRHDSLLPRSARWGHGGRSRRRFFRPARRPKGAQLPVLDTLSLRIR